MSSTIVEKYPPIDISFLHKKILEIILHFDQLFFQISPVKKYNQFPRLLAIEFHEKNLNQLQISQITSLSGTIKTIYELVHTAFINKFHETNEVARDTFLFAVPDDQSDEILRLENELFLKKKISLLQDFLTREVEYSEKLEKEIKLLQYQLNQSNLKTYRQKKSKSTEPKTSISTRTTTSSTNEKTISSSTNTLTDIEPEIRPISPFLSQENATHAEIIGDYILKVRERFLLTPDKYNLFLDLLAQFEKNEDVEKIVEDVWSIFDDQVDLMMDFYTVITNPSLPHVLRTLSLEKLAEVSSSSSSLLNPSGRSLQNPTRDENDAVVDDHPQADNHDETIPDLTPIPARKRRRDGRYFEELVSSEDEEEVKSDSRHEGQTQEDEDEMIEDFIDEDELLQQHYRDTHKTTSSSSTSGPNRFYEELAAAEERRRRDEEREERKRRRTEVIEKNKDKEFELKQQKKMQQQLKQQQKQATQQSNNNRTNSSPSVPPPHRHQQERQQPYRQSSRSNQNTNTNTNSNNHKQQSQPQQTKAERKQEQRNLVEKYVGKYVCREFQEGLFYGVIQRFNHPFFRIVYEDGDMEDINRTTLEGEGLICPEKDIPNLRKEACLLEAVKAKEKDEKKRQEKQAKRNRRMSRQQKQLDVKQELDHEENNNDSDEKNDDVVESITNENRFSFSSATHRPSHLEEDEDEDEVIIIRRKRDDHSSVHPHSSRPRIDSLEDEEQIQQPAAETAHHDDDNDEDDESIMMETDDIEKFDEIASQAAGEAGKGGEGEEKEEEIPEEMIPFSFPINAVESKPAGSPIPSQSSQSSRHSSPVTSSQSPLIQQSWSVEGPDHSGKGNDDESTQPQLDIVMDIDIVVGRSAAEEEQQGEEMKNSVQKNSNEDTNKDDDDDEIEVIEYPSPSKNLVCIDLSSSDQ